MAEQGEIGMRKSTISGATPRAGLWDFDGKCAADPYPGMQTFTLGIFMWKVMASGRGLKRGSVVQRIKGEVGDPQLAIDLARERVNFLNKDAGQ